MAHYCYVCKRVFTKDEGIAFFNFPRDPKRRMLWGLLIRQENIPLYGEICAKHFTPDCFVGIGLGRILKYTALPTIFDIPPTEGTQTKAHFGSSAANSVTDVALKEKITSIHKERERLKRKIASQTKCLAELKKHRFSYTDSSSSERKRLLLNPEEGRTVRKIRPKTSKPSATATQLGSGIPTTQIEDIRIEEKIKKEDFGIELETSISSATALQFGNGSTTALVENIVKKDPDEEDITLEPSVLEVENAKIKTEPLSDSEPEPPNLTQEYLRKNIQKYFGLSNAIFGVSQESRCNVVQKCPDPSGDVILGVPLESRCNVIQKCPDPSGDAILGVPLESRCNVVQKCPAPSDDTILGVSQESSCNVVLKCPDPSDAILGVPVEYLPISSHDICEKLEENQFSASGSATSVQIPFTQRDQATTSQNAPTLIPIDIVPNATAIPIWENLSAENSMPEILSDENSMPESLSDENSVSINRTELGLNFNLSKNLPQDFNKQKKDLLSKLVRNPETNSVKIKEEPLSESEDGPKQSDSESNMEPTLPDSESDSSDLMAEDDWAETFREDSEDEALGIPIQGGRKMGNSSIQMPLPVIKSVSSLSEMPYLQFPSAPITQNGPVPVMSRGTSPVLQNRMNVPLQECPRCAVIRNLNVSYDEPIVRISKSTQTAIIDLVGSEEASTDNDDLENRSTPTWTVEGSVVKKTEKQSFDSFGTFVAKRLNALGEKTGRFLQNQFGTLLYKVERGELYIR